MRMTWKMLMGLAGASLLVVPSAFAARPADPDWPCQQPLVPVITAATVWNGPSLEGIGDWHGIPAVAALVEHVTPRRVTTPEGEAQIAEFARGLRDDRAHLITLAFAGILAETNQQRAELIERIKSLAQRQRSLAALVDRLTTELDTIPATAQGEDADRRADLVQRRTYTARAFEEEQRTMRYVCETPVQLDARLGAYARALQDALPGKPAAPDR